MHGNAEEWHKVFSYRPRYITAEIAPERYIGWWVWWEYVERKLIPRYDGTDAVYRLCHDDTRLEEVRHQ